MLAQASMPEPEHPVLGSNLSVTSCVAQVAIDIDSGSSSRSSDESPTEAKRGKGVTTGKSAGKRKCVERCCLRVYMWQPAVDSVQCFNVQGCRQALLCVPCLFQHMS